MTQVQSKLEELLNSFDACFRADALEALSLKVQNGELELHPTTKAFNLHSHTFFSYNGYGFSPTSLAWQAYLKGLYAMGIVDFDVLDGVEEFLGACDLLNLRGTCGMETRVFVPEFADKVINSPGEPGVSYHMGMGFCGRADAKVELLKELRDTAQKRNENMVEKVNEYLAPVRVDYRLDVLPLTPNANATERHICTAFDIKARQFFQNTDDLCAYWVEKLGIPHEKVLAMLDDAPALQGQIRAKTMKQGGVGYVKPGQGDFPEAKTVNEFTLANHAIPTLAWLDGLSAGERAMGDLLELMVTQGVAALNIIPDRNWNIKDVAAKAEKVAAMDAFIALAVERDLPVFIGTEMNAFGQPFVDDFSAVEMRKHEAVFMLGANVLHGHTVLQRFGGKGYLSEWGLGHFPSQAERNAFYAKVGAAVAQPTAKQRDSLCQAGTPGEVAACLDS